MLTGRRRAIVIGINQYEDKNIPELSGAENDAQEVYQRLTDPNVGNFEVLNEHFLIGPRAKFKDIRKAVSDVFWRADPCDLALFYFSGHGFVDSYGNGYIGPYDIRKDEPFVCGANMNEIRTVVSRSKNPCVIMILDSCYSGIATKGDKSAPDYAAQFDANLKELSGEGRFVFASSAADQVSRERDLRHHPDDAPHSHGSFTFHLLNALDGSASDPHGIISLSDLQIYLDAQFQGQDRQKPKFHFAEASGLAAIKLALAADKYNQIIENKIREAERSAHQMDLSSLIYSTKLVTEVLTISPKHAEAAGLKALLVPILSDQKKRVDHWLTTNERLVRPALPRLFLEFDPLVNDLDFDRISKLSERAEQLLILLHKVATNEVENARFILKCTPFEPAESQQLSIGKGGPKSG